MQEWILRKWKLMKVKKMQKNKLVVNNGNCDKACIGVDTYTEQCFYVLCSQSNEKIKIFYEWQVNKEHYIKTTQTIAYDFQNYSAHDKTHSQAIIVAIEKFLGKDRIKKLGIGNLWLLLNAAYGHDIGMSIKNEEVLALWKDDEDFHDYIEKIANNPEWNLQKEARYYMQLHNMLNNNEQMEGLHDDKYQIYELTREWPIHLKKDVKIITNEYFRSKHSERSKKFLELFSEVVGMKIAEDRLYKVLGEVAFAHNEEYQYILKNLKAEVDGFGNEKMNPQFIASLLRLGDLLDMDNNRFDFYTLDHFGVLPAVSQSHLNKHMCLSHLLITEKVIEAIEMAEDKETCEVAAKWFGMIEEEIKNLTSNWNNIAPKRVGGCTFYKCDLRVYLNGLLYRQEQHNKFSVNEKKFMDVLIGDKLYDDPFVFMREYIQNAMDATKVMFGIKSAGEWINRAYERYEQSYCEISPFQLNKDYLDELSIEILVELTGELEKGEEEKFRITFRDKGIGMEEDCIKALSVIGNGWKGRTKYKKDIQDMYTWLRPTGGFGVGLQSGFMVADKIEINTLGMNERYGHFITLNTPREGGEINILDVKNIKMPGTEIVLNIKRERFINCLKNVNISIKEDVKPGDQWCYLDDWCLIENIMKIITKYIQAVVPNCLFPIKLQYYGNTGQVSSLIKGDIYNVIEKKNRFEFDSEFEYIYVQDIGKAKCKLYIWDCKNRLYARISTDHTNDKVDQFCYRGITVKRIGKIKDNSNGIISDRISIFMDFTNAKAEDWMLISRNDFRPEMYPHIVKQCDRVFRFYIKHLLDNKRNSYTNEAAAAVFLGMLKYGEQWGSEDLEKIASVNKTFVAEQITVCENEIQENNEDVKTYKEKKFNEKISNISIIEIFKMLKNGDPILWKPTVYGNNRKVEQKLVLEKMIKSYKINGGCSLVEKNIRRKLLEEKGHITVIEDEFLAFYLDEVKAKAKCYIELKNEDETFNKKLGYLEWRNGQKGTNTIEEIVRVAIDKGYSYLVLNDIEGSNIFKNLFVKRLPESYVTRNYCRDNDVILFPISNNMLQLSKSQPDENTGYSWDVYWNKLQKDKIWMRVVDWTVRHPKLDNQSHSRSNVIEQYKKLCSIAFDIIKTL